MHFKIAPEEERTRLKKTDRREEKKRREEKRREEFLSYIILYCSHLVLSYLILIIVIIMVIRKAFNEEHRTIHLYIIALVTQVQTDRLDVVDSRYAAAAYWWFSFRGHSMFAECGWPTHCQALES